MCIQWWIEDLEGMSNFYELEDNVWDEFGEDDDHIVPHAGDENKEQFAIQGNSCKKSSQELYSIITTDNVNSDNAHDKEKVYLMSQMDKMLERDSWSQTPEGVFPSCNANSSEEVKKLVSDNTGVSDHCFKGNNMDSSGSEFCTDDAILGDKCVVEDGSVCQYPINHISQTDNELSFLDNDGWLDIGNFEDVDRMFRSCDSTFGMGNLNNEEEFCWLSSSHSTEGSDEALKSDFKFSCAEASPMKIMSDYNSKPNIEGPPITDSNKNASLNRRLRSQMDVDDDAGPCPLSMFSESNMKSGYTDDLRFKDKMQRKLSKASEGRIKDDHLENGDSFHPFASPSQYGDVKQPNEASSSGVTSHASILKHKRNLSSGCIQTKVPLTCPDYSNAPNHTSLLPTSSVYRSELEGNRSPQKESSYASNMESISMSSTLEEISREATSFHQLQKVMDQLDIRTKMCLKDSLYRLAKSAEQRHAYANTNDSVGDNLEVCEAIVQDPSRCSGLMDMETDTNPIDRSIAHLLFHRPSDPSRF